MQFTEVQKFKRRWPLLAIGALNILFIYAIVTQIFLKQPFGTKPAPDAVLVITEICLILLLLFILSIKFTTIINEIGIQYRFSPFQFRTTTIKWDELSLAYMRQYNSFLEYGGWGIRKGTQKNGDAINTSASSPIGLQLEFKNGKRLLLGTAKPEQLQKLLEIYFK